MYTSSKNESKQNLRDAPARPLGGRRANIAHQKKKAWMDELSRAGLRVHTHTPWRGGQDSKTHTHAQERERERKTIELARRCFPAIHGPPPITRSETDRGCRRPLAEFDQSSRKHFAGLPLPLSPTFIHPSIHPSIEACALVQSSRHTESG